MNATNHSDGGRSTTGEHMKRKTPFPAENPKPPKSRKQASSRQDTFDDRVMPPFGQETPPKTSLDFPPPTHFSTSHFSGAHHFVSNGGTYNNIFGNYVVMEEPSDEDSEGRKLKGIIKGSRVLSVEDLSPERQIYKGRGYRFHSAHLLGKFVAMKVYEGSRALERCSEAARFNQKVMYDVSIHIRHISELTIQSSVIQICLMIGVSSLGSMHPFLVFDGEYEGIVNDMLGQVLKKDLKQILTLGLQTVVGLSSGLDYLQDLKYPFESVGLDHFNILSRKGQVVISFDPEDLDQTKQSDQQPGLSHNADSALAFFHELCQRTFDSACKAHYESRHIERAYIDEFDTSVNLAETRFEEPDSPSLSDPALSIRTSGRPLSERSPKNLPPNGRRKELVWKTPTPEALTLNDISHQFQDFLEACRSTSNLEPALNRRRGRYMARTAHRCPGYNRTEITLAADITRSAIVEHSTPIPHEICRVCKEVVKEVEVFNCICGGDDDEHISTVRCISCSEWHHWPCVDFLGFNRLAFVCERCQGAMRQQQLPPFPVIDFDGGWCSFCDRLIVPKHYTTNVPTAHPTLPSSPKRIKGQMDGLVGDTGRLRHNGTIKSPAPPVLITQRTIIEQGRPIPLYCSDECQIADLGNFNNQQLSSQSGFNTYQAPQASFGTGGTMDLDVGGGGAGLETSAQGG